jgi:hypothetical protein
VASVGLPMAAPTIIRSPRVMGLKVSFEFPIPAVSQLAIDCHGETDQLCGLCSYADHTSEPKSFARTRSKRARFVQRTVLRASPDGPCGLTIGENPNDSVIHHHENAQPTEMPSVSQNGKCVTAPDTERIKQRRSRVPICSGEV